MELAQVVIALRRAWWFVVLGALLGLAGAAAVNATSQVQYRANVQLFVAMSDQGASVGNALSGSQFAMQRVKSYLQVANTDEVTEPVVTRLRLPMTPGELADRITATSPLDTVLIQIAVTDTDAGRAAAIANEVADQFSLVVANLERPADQGDSPVKVSPTQLATVPTVPIAPRTTLNLALGLLAGLALGVGAALLRQRLDTTVKSADDLAAIEGAVPLGGVPQDPTSKQHPLVLADQSSPRAEAFRSLRTNLQFVDVDAPPTSIVITSPMPEDGKSTTACNIALTLAVNGARVVLVEADLRRPQACGYLGLDHAAGLTSVLAGQLELRDVLVEWNRGLMTVLPAGPVPPNPSELLGSRQMSALLRELERGFDHVIIDTAPLLPVTDAAVLAAIADGALVVVRHGRTRRDQAERAVQALTAVKARLLGTVINGVPRRGRGGYGYGYGYGDSPPAGSAGTVAAPSVSDLPPLVGAAPAPSGPESGRLQPVQHAAASASMPSRPAPVFGSTPQDAALEIPEAAVEQTAERQLGLGVLLAPASLPQPIPAPLLRGPWDPVAGLPNARAPQSGEIAIPVLDLDHARVEHRFPPGAEQHPNHWREPEHSAGRDPGHRVEHQPGHRAADPAAQPEPQLPQHPAGEAADRYPDGPDPLWPADRNWSGPDWLRPADRPGGPDWLRPPADRADQPRLQPRVESPEPALDLAAADRSAPWARPDRPADPVLIGAGPAGRSPEAPEGSNGRRHNTPRGTPPRGSSITGTPPNGTPVRGRHPLPPATAGRHRRH